MEFPLNLEAATEGASMLLSWNKGTMDMYTLVKILYFTEREIIGKWGSPLIGGSLVSREYGPLIDEIWTTSYDDRGFWSKHIHYKSKNILELISATQNNNWAESNIEILKKHYEENKNLSFDALHAKAEALPEHIPTKKGEKTDLSIEYILQKMGKSKEEIDSLISEAGYFQAFQKTLGKHVPD